jgi:hypothetical protein
MPPHDPASRCLPRRSARMPPHLPPIHHTPYGTTRIPVGEDQGAQRRVSSLEARLHVSSLLHYPNSCIGPIWHRGGEIRPSRCVPKGEPRHPRDHGTAGPAPEQCRHPDVVQERTGKRGQRGIRKEAKSRYRRAERPVSPISPFFAAGFTRRHVGILAIATMRPPPAKRPPKKPMSPGQKGILTIFRTKNTVSPHGRRSPSRPRSQFTLTSHCRMQQRGIQAGAHRIGGQIPSLR